jgi:hypothetical protein
MLGDRLYYGLMSERISKNKFRPFFPILSKRAEPGRVYSLIKKLGKMRLPKRV